MYSAQRNNKNGLSMTEKETKKQELQNVDKTLHGSWVAVRQEKWGSSNKKMN